MRSLGLPSPGAKKQARVTCQTRKKGLARLIAQSFSSRLLTPTLWEERTETAKALGVDHPALGAASGKEGAVYHNLASQGQTHFGRREQADKAWRPRRTVKDPKDLATPVVRAVEGLDDNRRPARGYGGMNLLEAQEELPGLSG
jgi:hypothetical protein